MIDFWLLAAFSSVVFFYGGWPFLTGSVLLVQGEEEINLQISQNVELDVEVEQKDKSRKGIQQVLEIELKWYEGDEGPNKSIKVKG